MTLRSKPGIAVVVGLGVVAAVWWITSKATSRIGDREPANPSSKSLGTPTPSQFTQPPEQATDLASAPLFEQFHGLPPYQYFNDEQPDRMFGAETNGGGLGWVDFDGNGFPDLYVVNGCRLPFNAADREYQDALFLNRGDGTFFDAAAMAGIQENQFGQGISVGDFDNDGWDDLYICNFGTNTLLHNCGDGTFLALNADAGAGATGWNAGAAFGDVNHDGNLDLYVTVYAVADLEDVPVCYDSASGTRRVYCGPDRYSSTRHHFFLNNGDGTFQDATIASGCDKTNGKGMGVVIADLDHDTWPEIFVANDMTPSFLYHNLNRTVGESPRFEEIGVESGVAFNGQGRPMAGMGIACGDADGDGWIDLYVSHYHRQGNTFYQNKQRLSFRDHTAAMNLLVPSLPFLGFGCEFFDVDNDGWLDLYVVNGHVLGPQYPDWKMKPQVFRNLNGERFAEVTHQAGSYFQGAYLGRGSATSDFDNDGAIDLAVLHLDRPVALLHNVLKPRGQSLGFKCVGLQSNRNGVNTEIVFHVGDRTLTRQVIGGGSYQSAPDYRGLVGTGERSQVDRIELHWPSGKQEEWQNVAADGLYLFCEGRPPRKLLTWESQKNVRD